MNLIELLRMAGHVQPPTASPIQRQKYKLPKQVARKSNAGARRIRRNADKKGHEIYHKPESRASRRARGVLAKRNRTHRPGRRNKADSPA